MEKKKNEEKKGKKKVKKKVKPVAKRHHKVSGSLALLL